MAGSLRLSGNQFHITGPAREKARRPSLLRRWQGTTRRPRLAERRCCLEATLETDWQRSTRYRGAWLCRPTTNIRCCLEATLETDWQRSTRYRGAWLCSWTPVKHENSSDNIPCILQIIITNLWSDIDYWTVWDTS